MMARKMKASGVDWIGDVPVNWQLKRVKNVAALSSGHYLDRTDIDDSGPYPVFGANGFRGYHQRFNSHGLNSFTIGRVGAIGELNMLDKPTWVTDNAFVCYSAFYQWLYLWFTAQPLSKYASVTAQPLLNGSVVKNSMVSMPPQREQLAITSYLDDRTTAIDSKIQLLEEKSKSLTELRKSVVHQAVTKGLDLNVMMKPSGVDWIGDVPAHWQMKRVKDITTCLDGKREPLNAVQRAEMQGSIPYWGANNIVDHIDRFKLDGEYVLLGEDGAPFDKPLREVAFRVTGKFWPNNHIHVLHSRNNMSWLTYFLNAVDYSPYVGGATRLKLTQGDMNRMMLTMPPSSEQIAIAKYLDERTSIIDENIKTIAAQITAMKSLRQSLIHEAVTGKIDVADYGYHYV